MARDFRTHEPGLPEPGTWLTVYVPALVYPLMIATIFVWYDFWYFMKDKEGGIEWVAIVTILVGVGYGVTALAKYRSAFPKKWLTVWFSLGVAGMIVFAGEEMSWGQHLGFWGGEDIPEGFRELNDQNETNIHNLVGIGNAIDRGSTNAIVGGTFFAFVILPFIQRAKRETMSFTNPGYWFWPTRAGLVAGLGVLLIRFPERIYMWTTGAESTPFDWRHSEIHEFYIGLLMTIYMVSLHHRLKAYATGETSGSSAYEKPAPGA
ncbi:MAG: hypothetical protein RLN60_03875 [Phycisphaerales bacterium]